MRQWFSNGYVALLKKIFSKKILLASTKSRILNFVRKAAKEFYLRLPIPVIGQFSSVITSHWADEKSVTSHLAYDSKHTVLSWPLWLDPLYYERSNVFSNPWFHVPGLIFHSSFIGRAGSKNKGRISRYLANKCRFVAISHVIVADPRCLSRIPDLNFYHPGSASKNLNILTQKRVSTLSEIWSGLFFSDPDPEFFPFRIQGSKRHRIPDPQHCPRQCFGTKSTWIVIGFALFVPVLVAMNCFFFTFPISCIYLLYCSSTFACEKGKQGWLNRRTRLFVWRHGLDPDLYQHIMLDPDVNCWIRIRYLKHK